MWRRRVLLDERAIANLIDQAVRRARALLAAEVFVWAAFAAATTLVVTRAFRLSILASVVAAASIALIAGGTAWFVRRHGVSRTAVVWALEQAEPSLMTLLFTASELTGGQLTASPRVRARVFAGAAAITHRVDLRRALPASRALRAAIVAATAWLLLLPQAMS